MGRFKNPAISPGSWGFSKFRSTLPSESLMKTFTLVFALFTGFAVAQEKPGPPDHVPMLAVDFVKGA